MNGRQLIFIFCFIIPIIRGQGTRDQQSICEKQNTPQATWTCKRIADCTWSTTLLGSNQEYRCGANKRDQKICCPEKRNSSTSNTATVPQYIKIINKKCMDYAGARYQNVCRGGQLLQQKENCTRQMDCKQSVEVLIVNGQAAELKEFPHMALIGYGEDIDSIEWKCGGSLISERFVLTAAHCNQSNIPPKWVGLGLLPKDKFTPDTLNTNLFPIKKMHIHPKYSEFYSNDDIALFELKNSVPFTAHIRPLCLHTQHNIPQQARTNATILGWGAIGGGLTNSDTLLKATVAFLPDETCLKVYGNVAQSEDGFFDGKTMVCAGDTKHKDDDIRDTCQGDSGGPIQMNHKEECMYVQVGVTSLGSKFCGDGTPAIYTRVSAYLEWIQKIVWPQNKSRS